MDGIAAAAHTRSEHVVDVLHIGDAGLDFIRAVVAFEAFIA